MDKVMAQEMGFLGVNVPSNFDLAWLQTEVVNKMNQGDTTSAFQLLNIARHSDDEAVKTYAIQMVQLHPEMFGGEAIAKEPEEGDKSKDNLLGENNPPENPPGENNPPEGNPPGENNPLE